MASEFYTKRLAQLVGGTVSTVIVGTDPLDGQEFFGLRIKVRGQLLDLWLLSDDEGNAPGSFDLTPVEGEK